jgi:hypothetical protein
MKYSKLIRGRTPDIIFVALIATCFFVYFVIYMTPSRIAWYGEMRNQMVIMYHILMDMRR